MNKIATNVCSAGVVVNAMKQSKGFWLAAAIAAGAVATCMHTITVPTPAKIYSDVEFLVGSTVMYALKLGCADAELPAKTAVACLALLCAVVALLA